MILGICRGSAFAFASRVGTWWMFISLCYILPTEPSAAFHPLSFLNLLSWFPLAWLRGWPGVTSPILSTGTPDVLRAKQRLWGLEGTFHPTTLCYGGGSWSSERRSELPLVFWLFSGSVRTELRSLPLAQCCLFYDGGSQRVFSYETGVQEDEVRSSPAKSNTEGLSPTDRKKTDWWINFPQFKISFH